jgi:NAD(P)-dependent dehydrogenase (short-subunit alcohol dehydrogenase family)
MAKKKKLEKSPKKPARSRKSQPATVSATMGLDVGANRLAGRVALVTGGNRGLGLAFAKALAAQGCDVVVTGRDEAQLSLAGSELAKLGAHVLTHHCDVRDERSVTLLLQAIREQFGHIDILINNAGIAHSAKNIEELSLKEWRDTVDTNLTGMFLVTRSALPLIVPGGAIVNNLSVAAKTVFPGMAAYNASKFGAMGFTKALRAELQPRGIRVIALMPGATDTDIWLQFWPSAPRKKMLHTSTIANALVSALMLPEEASVNELLIAPTAGAL